MRPINRIILHCSATAEGKDYTVADIDQWHKARGWQGIGYHYVVYRDGSIHNGRPIEAAGAHTSGYNKDSIGICYIGGVDANGKPKDTRTPEQKKALRELVTKLKEQFPNATVHGHYELAQKACPSFHIKYL